MDSTTTIANRILAIAASRRVRAFSIAVLVLTTLAVLQVNNLRQNAPMCDLLANSNLRNADVQRIQIALSQAGLDEYRLIENRLMVPTAKHSLYLQAVAQQNAIPEELRRSDESVATSVNPFLSRSQQLAIEKSEKKHQVRDMVLRLPFVEQAWFEMDKSESHSAFERAEHSAVVSIRTTQNVSLSDQHVDTVKRMIGGAVAGLDSENIVVIDLSAGFAHDKHLDPSTTKQVHFQRIAIEQQRFYENQIREILKAYPGVKVQVHVDVIPLTEESHVAFIPESIPANTPPSNGSRQFAGANSYASIENTFEPTSQPVAPAKIELISNATSVLESDRVEKQISVSIDVPQKLVHDLFGAPTRSSSFAVNRTDLQARMAKETNTKFEQLRSEIIQKIQPVLPQSTRQNAKTNPITVNLIRDPLPESAQWYAQVQEIAVQNWPSAAVLIIGIMLLSIVTRKPETLEATANIAATSDGDVLSINSNLAGESAGGPEVRLTKLIEKDPDAAARVIEAWIRDAA